jgi:hypothetical protein
LAFLRRTDEGRVERLRLAGRLGVVDNVIA